VGTVILSRAILTGNGDLIEEGTVRVADGLIQRIDRGYHRSLVEGGDDVIDLRSATLLPGLIDLHNHLNGDGKYSIGDDSVREPEATWALVLAAHARRELMHGVTTVRVPGAPFNVDVAVRKSIHEGYSTGPRLICAGEKISMTGGHGYGHGCEADGAAEVMRASRELIKVGVDFIKVTASGGVGSTREGEVPVQPEMTVEEMGAAVVVAHSAGLQVAAHADGVPGVRNALAAGVDTVEHGIFMGKDEAEDMARRGVALVPTLAVMREIAYRGEALGLPSRWIPNALGVLGPHMESFKAAREAGVLFGAGTDGFCDLIDELEAFVEAGIAPYAAVQAATRDAAKIIRRDGTLGTIDVGKTADLIAVPGNPIEDLDLLRRPSFVMRDGTVYLTATERS
jgi:imidazolonepropionase-like amidohydrolase